MSRALTAVIALGFLFIDLTGSVAFGQRPGRIGRASKRDEEQRDKIEPPPIASDPSVKLDYDIVYIRAPRRGDDVGTNWAEISSPLFMDAGSDLVLLHPDGKEELLVAGGKGAVADPMVSFDGEWVYYSLFHDLEDATITEACTGWCRHLQDPRRDATGRPADSSAIHTQYRRRRLVERLSHG